MRLNRLSPLRRTRWTNKDYAAAAQIYQDYLAKKPDDADAHFDLGYAYTAEAKPADAKAEYEKAISLDPKMEAAYSISGSR